MRKGQRGGKGGCLPFPPVDAVPEAPSISPSILDHGPLLTCRPMSCDIWMVDPSQTQPADLRLSSVRKKPVRNARLNTRPATDLSSRWPSSDTPCHLDSGSNPEYGVFHMRGHRKTLRPGHFREMLMISSDTGDHIRS